MERVQSEPATDPGPSLAPSDVELAVLVATPSTTADVGAVSSDGVLPESTPSIAEGGSDKERLVWHAGETEDADSDDHAVSSMPQTIFNFVNTIIGSGVIGLPFALREAGFFLGIIEIVLFGFLTQYTVNLLIESGEIAKKQSYPALGRHSFGVIGYLLVAFFTFGQSFGAMLGYTVIIGDTLPRTMAALLGADAFLAQRAPLMVAATVLVMLPLSSLRYIGKLAHSSLISAILVLGILGIISVVGGVLQADPATAVALPPDAFAFAHPHFLEATGTIAFTYVCQHNSFLLYRSLVNRTLPRWVRTARISALLSMLVCLGFGVSGYLAFYDSVHGNALNNYPLTNPAIITARIMFALVMMLTYPLESQVARHAVEEVWDLFCELRRRPRSPFRWPVHLGRVVVLVALALLLALLVGDNLGLVLELNGSVNATALSLVLPPLLFVRVAPGPLRSPRKLVALAVAVAGGTVGVVATVLDVIALFSGTADA